MDSGAEPYQSGSFWQIQSIEANPAVILHILI